MRGFGTISACLAILCAGCASYKARPLEEGRILDDLRGMTLETAAVGVPQADPASFNLADGLSESEAAAVTLALNPDLAARRAEAGVAESQLLAAGLYPDPALDAGWIGRGGGEWDGKLLQELPVWGERGIRQERARLRLSEVRHDIAAAEWVLVQEVRRAFTDLVWHQERADLGRANLDLRRRVLELVRARQELGAASALDASLAAVDAARQEHDLLAAELDRERARRRLNALMGLDPGVVWAAQAGSGFWADASDPPDPGRLDEAGVARRQDLAALRDAYEQAERALQLATRGQYPRLGIGPSYMKDGEGEGAGIGIGLTIPLWNRNRGEIAEKLSEREKSWQAFRAALAAARAGWAGAAEDLRRRRRILDLYREKVRPELEKSLTLAEESLRAGKADLTFLLVTQDRLYGAGLEQIEARAEARKAVIALEEALGAPLADGSRDGVEK